MARKPDPKPRELPMDIVAGNIAGLMQRRRITPLEIPEGTSAKRKLLMKAAGRNLEQTAKLLNFFIDIGLLK